MHGRREVFVRKQLIVRNGLALLVRVVDLLLHSQDHGDCCNRKHLLDVYMVAVHAIGRNGQEEHAVEVLKQISNAIRMDICG
jgi:hypothetical protein